MAWTDPPRLNVWPLKLIVPPSARSVPVLTAVPRAASDIEEAEPAWMSEELDEKREAVTEAPLRAWSTPALTRVVAMPMDLPGVSPEMVPKLVREAFAEVIVPPPVPVRMAELSGREKVGVRVRADCVP